MIGFQMAVQLVCVRLCICVHVRVCYGGLSESVQFALRVQY